MTRLMSGVFAAVALAAGAYAITGYNSQTRLPDLSLVGAATAQEAEVDTSTIVEMVVGAEDAPVTLIEYASYTCVHCANFHKEVYPQIEADYIDTGKVKLIYREVYFDRYGLWASMIARCGGPEKFFGISDLIYKGQSDWTRAGGASEVIDALRKIGAVAGLDKDTVEACLQDGAKAQTLVSWYQENATADGVESTPSFVLNGTKIANQSYASFKALIDAELDG
ncbi:DsbA family protein [Phaeobacter sp. 11ANDIMAR09]|uniref:DsbA family protein n=1 Tax=Phaeobacter sp. 11ANDIMAR09 TaxID=1225647 RepID=UPI0006C85FAB|nr:DsbA family protein [Phaeobacter sp. 11ANDIMAR09]KPD12134.1 thiol-disulfide oxidoreductase [Phaeobacter sp. 11ANDIMAR09]